MLLDYRPAFLFAAVLAATPLFQPLRAQAPEPAAETTVELTDVTAVEPVVDDATAQAIVREGIENSQVMRILRDLTGKVGHRLTGSDNFTAACDWAVAEFRQMGLQNVHKEEWGQWNVVWNRGEWTGRIVEPIELDMYVATAAWTAGTDGLQRGRVRYAPENPEELEQMGDVQGQFFYYTGRAPRGELRDDCERAGIAGWVYKARGNAEYPTRVRVFGNHRVAMGSLEDVPTMPEIAVRSDHAEQLEELLDAGREVVCEFRIDNEFKPGPITLHNVIAEIPGASKPDEVVIVCGHLDSWHQAQGCTDNGTGTATTMAAARILAAVGAKPERTIRFCLWGGEEQGLLGSAAYVRRHRDEMDKVSAVFNHDTGTNWAAALTVADTMYEPMLRVFAPVQELLTAPDEDHIGKPFKLNRSETISGGGGSDHASFIAAGVPGLNWTLKGRSDYFGYTWHTQWDTFEVAIPEYQRHTATVVALAALGTANLPELLDRSGVQRRSGRRQSRDIAQAIFGAEMDGMKFTKVEEGGVAARMGAKVGDVLYKIEGREIEQMFDIFRAARDAGEDQKALEVELKRGDEVVKTRLMLEDLRRRGRRRDR